MIIRTWAAAKKIKLIRSGPDGLIYQNETLEPGVNFFVLALEQLGAQTEYSCEGHPNGFYIMFNAPLCTAQKIRNCGYFNVELEPAGRWSLRVSQNFETLTAAYPNARAQFFSRAAKAWVRAFGPVFYDNLTHEKKSNHKNTANNVRISAVQN